MTPEDIDEEGWAGTRLVEPLTALAGGILGGITAVAVAYLLITRTPHHRGEA